MFNRSRALMGNTLAAAVAAIMGGLQLHPNALAANAQLRMLPRFMGLKPGKKTRHINRYHTKRHPIIGSDADIERMDRAEAKRIRRRARPNGSSS